MGAKGKYTADKAAKAGLIAAPPIGRAIERWAATQWFNEIEYHGEEAHQYALHTSAWLAEKTGIHIDTITKIRSGKKEWVEFDNADRLLCAMRVPWDSNPELDEIYQTFDFSWLDLQRPTCREADPLPLFDGLSARVAATVLGVSGETIFRRRKVLERTMAAA